MNVHDAIGWVKSQGTVAGPLPLLTGLIAVAMPVSMALVPSGREDVVAVLAALLLAAAFGEWALARRTAPLKDKIESHITQGQRLRDDHATAMREMRDEVRSQIAQQFKDHEEVERRDRESLARLIQEDERKHLQDAIIHVDSVGQRYDDLYAKVRDLTRVVVEDRGPRIAAIEESVARVERKVDGIDRDMDRLRKLGLSSMGKDEKGK